jgi:hypothetical protein
MTDRPEAALRRVWAMSARSAFFGEVAPRPGLEGVDDWVVVGAGGEDYDGDVRVALGELAGGLDAVQDRHPQVEQDRVGAGLLDDFEGFPAVCGRSDYLDAVGQAEQDRQLASAPPRASSS